MCGICGVIQVTDEPRLPVEQDVLDRGSMAHSLEVRVPFLDHHVIELVATIPNGLKADGRLTRKAILRRVAGDLVPHRIHENRKVGFFSHAVEGWFRAQADWLLRRDTATAEVFYQSRFRRLVEAWASGARVNARLLLALLVLQIWLADTLSGALAGERPRPETTA